MSPAKNAVESLRDIVQDLLVPELKAIKVSVESGHTEVGYLRDETRSSFDALRQEMRLRDEKMEQLIRHGDEKNEQAIHTLGGRLTLRLKSANDLRPLRPGFHASNKLISAKIDQ